MSDAADKQDFKAALTELLAAFDARQAVGAVDQYAGVGDPEPLEHTTRVLLLDGILRSLGWDLTGGRDVAEEARIEADTTIFMDYLGVDPLRRTPLLIVEAKAWSKPCARGRDGRVKGGPSDLILRAISHIRSGGAADRSPVTGEWHEWLVQVRDYVAGLLGTHGHNVERVVITTGQWMVIFIRPVKTFCTDTPLVEEDCFVLLKEDFVESSDDIFDLIARKRLIKTAPSLIRVTQIHAYLRPAALVGVFHSALVKYEESGFSHVRVTPQIHVYPAVTLVRNDGQVLTVHGGYGPYTIPHTDGDEGVKEHLREVEAIAQALLDEVSKELSVPLEPVEIIKFSGFVARPRRSAISALGAEDLREPSTTYVDMDPAVARQGIVATGRIPHFLLPEATMRCRFHDWGNCRRVRMEANTYAITVRSIKPRSFFKSGEQHHCAHQGMHDVRQDRCKIDPIDRYLCCMTCSFQTVCWPVGQKDRLPCGT